MKHLTSYKIFEADKLNYDAESKVEGDKEVILDIKDCFLSVGDLLTQTANSGISVKFIDKSIRNSKQQYVIFDHVPQAVRGIYSVFIAPQILPEKEGQRYRSSKMNGEVISEIENSMSLVEGTIELYITSVLVEYATGLDYDKGERGPGIVNKLFKKGGIEPPSDLTIFTSHGGAYNIDCLFDFLYAKGDK